MTVTRRIVRRLRWGVAVLVAADALFLLCEGLGLFGAGAALFARWFSFGLTLFFAWQLWRLSRGLAASNQAKDDALRLMREILDALPAAVVLWDADDRLLFANAAFRAQHGALADMVQPGITFEGLLREAVRRDPVPDVSGPVEDWIAERLAAHRRPAGPVLRRHPDGSWRRVTEQHLPDGSLLTHSADVTELVLNEQALDAARRDAEQAGERLRDAIEALPATFELYDDQDRLVMHNRRFERTYPHLVPHLGRGLRFADLARLNIGYGAQPGAVDGADAWIAKREEQRRAPRPGESVLLPTRDGRQLRMFETRLKNGGVVAIRVDVTEVEAQRQALDEAHRIAELATARLEDAIEALPAGFELYDTDDRLVMINSVMEEMYPKIAGLAAQRPTFEEVVRANHARGGLPHLHDEAALQAWLDMRQAERREPGGGDNSRTVRQPDGRWIRSHERRTRDGGLVGVRIDITEAESQRARAEASKAAAEQASTRLHDAIEALPDAFVLFDADDRIVVHNRRYLELYAESAAVLKPGVRFEDVLRYGLANGQYPQARGREEAWLAERLAAHRHPAGPLLQELPGNRWLRIDERRTPSGGVAGVRAEVTELVRREQELSRLNARLDALNIELERLSDTDPLTGLANRRQFDRRLAEEASRAERHGMPLAMLLLDVDHFKPYNDLHGHPAGDACLQRVATVLRDSARRPTDLVARWGGEEFAMLLPYAGADEALDQAKRCIAALDEAALPHGGSPLVPQVTLSAGVSLFGDPDAADAAALVAAADAALYRAKQAGRHRAVLAACRV